MNRNKLKSYAPQARREFIQAVTDRAAHYGLTAKKIEIVRNCALVALSGHVGMITIPNWMFLSSYQTLRGILLRNHVVATLIHNGRGVWGSDFGSCSFVLRNTALPRFEGSYKRLFDQKGSIATNDELNSRFFTKAAFHVPGQCFLDVPGNPPAYWVGENVLSHFSGGKKDRRRR